MVSCMRYYPIQKRWQKIKPHIQNKEVQRLLVRDFNKYTFGRWKKEFKKGMTPHEFESCDWWCDHRGRMPEYWNYVKHAACHWLVNFNLALARVVEPNRNWRIVTSQLHSTVWDGDETLFDFNFLAMGVDPNEAFELAMKENTILPYGKYRRVYTAQYWRDELPKQKYPQEWN